MIFVGGLTATSRARRCACPIPGFAGGDRTDIALPALQQKLLEALHATGKPVVLVLMTGSAVAVELGAAEAARDRGRLVSGPARRPRARRRALRRREPGGPAAGDVLQDRVQELPPFDDYAMEGRTYRYFRGEPLYPFGHGLSYSRFEYAGPAARQPRRAPSDRLQVSVAVKNVGPRDADEVVQLYVSDVESQLPDAGQVAARLRTRPPEARRGAARPLPLEPRARLPLLRRGRKAYAVEPGEFEIQMGASSRDVRLRGRVRVAAK